VENAHKFGLAAGLYQLRWAVGPQAACKPRLATFYPAMRPLSEPRPASGCGPSRNCHQLGSGLPAGDAATWEIRGVRHLLGDGARAARIENHRLRFYMADRLQEISRRKSRGQDIPAVEATQIDLPTQTALIPAGDTPKPTRRWRPNSRARRLRRQRANCWSSRRLIDRLTAPLRRRGTACRKRFGDQFPAPSAAAGCFTGAGRAP